MSNQHATPNDLSQHDYEGRGDSPNPNAWRDSQNSPRFDGGTGADSGQHEQLIGHKGEAQKRVKIKLIITINYQMKNKIIK